MKKVLSVMLAISMLFPLCNGFNAVNALDNPEGTPVSTVEEFLNMSQTGVYYLANDIDFSGKTYNHNVYTKIFKGVLNGNGHALLGISIEANAASGGIFQSQFGGTLKNITIGSPEAPVSITSTGTSRSTGVVAGTVVDGACFDYVTIYADVNSEGLAAGFTCFMPKGKLTITNSKVYGSIKGNPAAGFVAMTNTGSSDVEIVGCENYADIIGANLSAGGIYTTSASVSGSRNCNLVIKGCVNYGAISATDWRVGGIVGEFSEELSSTLNVEYCYNLGSITMTGAGGFAGGIVGGMCFDAPTGLRRVANVYNAGVVRNTANSGNAFAVSFAHSFNEYTILENATYVSGTHSKNCNTTNITQVSDAREMLSVVLEYPSGGEGLSFYPDTGNQNEGYPILEIQNLNHKNRETFACGRIVCKDCGLVLSLSENENHSYTDTVVAPNGYLNGYVTSECQYCKDFKCVVGQLNDAAVTPVDGIYTFTNPEHLMWYSANQNAGLLNGNEHICLGADIDMKGFDYIPIAESGKGFTGTINGCGHTISNLAVTTQGAGGLIAIAGTGATITDLAVDNATVSAKQHAGVLVGDVYPGAIISIDRVSVYNATVASTDGNAGGIVGSSACATEVSVDRSVVDSAKISGISAGGILGYGDFAILHNVYVNATLTANGSFTGSLAYHNGNMKVEYCGYSKATVSDLEDGDLYETSAFSSGEIAYLINTYGATRVFGLKDGKTAISHSPAKMVRLGSKKIYTTNAFAVENTTAVYAFTDGNKMTLAILQVQNASERLVDSKITVNSTEVKFSDLTLCKYVNVNGEYYTAPTGCVLYTVSMELTNAPMVQIGNTFNATATLIQ